MKRILVLILATLTGATLVLAQEKTEKPKPERSKPPLTDEQSAQLEQELNEEWNALPVQSKLHLMHLHRALTEMPPDERRFIHDRIERFIKMTPAERERLAELRKEWEQMSPEERQKAREDYRNWRREHPGQTPPPFPPNKPSGPPPTPEEPAPPAPAPPPPPAEQQ
ncbi:MAG TPA: DUF3106 domain-containing protein [Verrucomicrobiae bacterium]|nr:DUF3106 domain-containing protein [Verrucomicrobiae bacterium]